jgi:septum formation inhibitor MinC
MRLYIRNARIFAGRNAANLFSLALLICSAVPCHSIQAQTVSPQEKPMKHYALIFHTTRTLTHEELEQRKLEIAAWVKRVTDMGITLDPRALGETEETFSTEGNEIVSHKRSSDPKLRNLVFFDSPSRDQAVHIARIHPGLHYGATVEVREWTSPRETTVKQ